MLPLLLHIMDSHPVNDILERVSEALVNLSSLRRNRREIASCGVASHLERCDIGLTLVSLLAIQLSIEMALYIEFVRRCHLVPCLAPLDCSE